MLTLENLSKTYRTAEGPVLAARDVSFSVATGEVVSLLGPSGCGKTTALRSIAGLERPDEGRITVHDKAVFDSTRRLNLPSHRRPIGMVFQSYAVWPHMTVFENVAYPLRVMGRRAMNKSELTDRVMRALDRVRIGNLAQRKPAMLSGGQQQRVAIARALVRDAAVLLFDEPLSNLDAKLREEMRGELRELFVETGVTVVYVTHDLPEALALSDRLIVLEAGRIVQTGAPEEVYSRPATEFVAKCLGNVSLAPGDVRSRIGDLAVIDTDLGECMVEVEGQVGNSVTVLMRPEAIRLVAATNPGVQARVDARLYLGGTVEYRLHTADEYHFTARLSYQDERFEVGDTVTVELDRAGLSTLPASPASTDPFAIELVDAEGAA